MLTGSFFFFCSLFNYNWLLFFNCLFNRFNYRCFNSSFLMFFFIWLIRNLSDDCIVYSFHHFFWDIFFIFINNRIWIFSSELSDCRKSLFFFFLSSSLLTFNALSLRLFSQLLLHYFSLSE